MRRLIATLAAVCLLLGAAGCGGGGDGKVAVDRYAGSVCTALGTWREQLTTASTVLAQKTSATNDLRDVRRQFVAFFGGAIDVTDEMLASVDKAGVPDIDQGEKIAAALEQDLRRFRPILVDARKAARQLPVGDPTGFALQAQRLGSRFQIEINGLATMFQALDEKYGAPDLVAAADADASCRAL